MNLTCKRFIVKSNVKHVMLIYNTSAFKDYLSGKCPAEQYHSICKIVTEGFQDVSLEIQVIEREITDKVIAGMIRALQQGEKEKLEKVRFSFTVYRGRY